MPTSNTTDHVFGGVFTFLSTPCSIPAASFRGRFFRGVGGFTFHGTLYSGYRMGGRGNVVYLVGGNSCGTMITGLLGPRKLGCNRLPGKLLRFRRCRSRIHAPVRRRLMRTTLCTDDGNRTGIRFAISRSRLRLFGRVMTRGTSGCTRHCNVGCGVSFSRRGPDASAVTTGPSGAPFHGRSKSLLFHPNNRNTLVRGLGRVSTSMMFVGGVSGIIPSHLGTRAIA